MRTGLLIVALATSTYASAETPMSRIAITAALPSPKAILPSRWRRLQSDVAHLRQSGVEVTLAKVPLEEGPQVRTMTAGTRLRSVYVGYSSDATLAHELQHLSDKTRGVPRTLVQSEVAANYAATGDTTKAVELTVLNHPEVSPAIDALRAKDLAGRALFRAIIRGDRASAPPR